MEVIFLAAPDQLSLLGENSHPREYFVSLDCQGFHREIRAQVYALIMNLLFDDAMEKEYYIDTMPGSESSEVDDDGPVLWQLEDDLVEQIALTDEDRIHQLAKLLPEFGLISEADLAEEDLSEFLFTLVNLARTSQQDEHTNLYLLSR